MSDVTSRPLKIRVARKSYPAVAGRDEQVVLKDISIDIEPRSFVVLTGPSGSGKSTLLNIVAGLDQDYEGEVDLGGPDVNIGYIFQSPRLLPWRTVGENIALALPDGDSRHDRIEEMLRHVGLDGFSSQYPERLSLGMQRRAALARGFITEPDVLLMDEPFVSLDDPTAQGLRELLIGLWNRRPTTVIFITHDRTEAVMLGTRILRLSGANATIVQEETVRLSPSERTDRDKVRAEQNRIFEGT
ncbi:ATP-binding cassette domain-containing protein [Hyphomicrobium sp. LHD-15]|uniref:ABC transporter ATP-binding protein n=1 Tax=Hyphomicrobium sp. LHD-15 TaxID=3072142 RepID=UPI0028103437|nr:ATP-binding cassette domain-containing protein [Hyphomicrobium sp. LHD-15]MDQ8697406.1 ATP-binding cassette domain-containing protein [Hyphomicrobium sp. LHD-15]